MVNTPPPQPDTAEPTPLASLAHPQTLATGTPRRKKTIKQRVRQSLIATSAAVLFAAAALSLWIINSKTETIILRAANYALSGIDTELTDIRLGPMALAHWQVSSVSLRVHDSHIVIKDLDIQLALNWPKSIIELRQLGQFEGLHQKIKRISTGDIEVELGQSLLERNPSITDKQTPSIALNIKSLPLIELGKIRLSLAAQANHDAYQLQLDKLSLDQRGQLTTTLSHCNEPFGHCDEPLIGLAATLSSDEWTLKTKLNIAPLLESLHQISLRQTPSSILSQLMGWDQQWRALGITLSGQLVSQTSIKLATCELSSEHQFIQPMARLAHFADFTIAPQPALAFSINGSLTALKLTLNPFSLALQPNAAQQTQLLDALQHSQLLNDADFQALNTLLTGLNSTPSPVGLALSMTESLHFPLAKSAAVLNLPVVELSTLGSKLETRIRLTNTSVDNTMLENILGNGLDKGLYKNLDKGLDNSHLSSKTHSANSIHSTSLSKAADAWWLQTQWHIALKQDTEINLAKLWRDAPQGLSWGAGALKTAGIFSLRPSAQGIDWQLKTIPIAKESTDTLQLTLSDIKQHKTTQVANIQNKQTQLALGKIQLNAKGPLLFSATAVSAQDVSTAANQQAARHQTTNSQTTNSQFALNLPPISLALEQLRFSQAEENLAINHTDAASQNQPLNQPLTHSHSPTTSSAASLGSRNDISIRGFSLGISQGIAVNFSRQQPLLAAIQARQLSNQLHWQAQQLTIEKQLSAKGRTRKQTVLKLDNFTLVQDLHWQINTLMGDEQWQVGSVTLQSQHQLQLANTKQPLQLTGQWVVDTSMTEALALLNQTQPLPAELNMTGHNQLQAQFKLTHQPEQTQFAMQITQSMTELEGFYRDTLFEGGKLQAQCEFTWVQTGKMPQTSADVSQLSRLNCPQTTMTFTLFDPGFPLTDIEVNADIVLDKDAEKLPDNWLQQLTGLSATDVSMTAKGSVLSGQFFLPEFNLKLQDKSHTYLILQGMDLEEVLRIQPQIGIYANGLFDGVLPVDLVDGQISISGGQLAARAPGGLIAISGNPAVDQMRQSQPYLDFVFSTLEHLAYSQLSSSFDMEHTGDASLLVEIKGRSQGIERPIHLNYSHEENMLQLFRSLQIGNDLQDRIEQSVK